ncbi:MAG: hypothetical protein MZV49_14770 [Rhodopseudomonas palustris]|nr:hypothetical protein [Rhodopseudomonas palustris]
MKNLLGGKGANLAEMTSIGSAGPGRLHHHHRGLHRVLHERPQLSGRTEGRGRRRTWRRSRR